MTNDKLMELLERKLDVWFAQIKFNATRKRGGQFSVRTASSTLGNRLQRFDTNELDENELE